MRAKQDINLGANLLANKINQLEKSILSDFDDMLNYYHKEKEKNKMLLETTFIHDNERVKLYKKISVYALKIELINDFIGSKNV